MPPVSPNPVPIVWTDRWKIQTKFSNSLTPVSNCHIFSLVDPDSHRERSANEGMRYMCKVFSYWWSFLMCDLWHAQKLFQLKISSLQLHQLFGLFRVRWSLFVIPQCAVFSVHLVHRVHLVVSLPKRSGQLVLVCYLITKNIHVETKNQAS